MFWFRHDSTNNNKQSNPINGGKLFLIFYYRKEVKVIVYSTHYLTNLMFYVYVLLLRCTESTPISSEPLKIFFFT